MLSLSDLFEICAVMVPRSVIGDEVYRFFDVFDGLYALRRSRRQRSEQYLTSSQTFSHFLRQENGRPQVSQVLDGRSHFFTERGIRQSFEVNPASTS